MDRKLNVCNLLLNLFLVEFLHRYFNHNHFLPSQEKQFFKSICIAINTFVLFINGYDFICTKLTVNTFRTGILELGGGRRWKILQYFTHPLGISFFTQTPNVRKIYITYFS